MKNIKAVEIEINSECNRACSYCPNSDQKRIENGNITEKLFSKILSNLSEINYSGRISFSFYNEPLLSNQLEKLARMTKKILPKCNLLIYTNGTLLTKSKLLSLIESGIDSMVVTKHENEQTDYVFDKTIQEISTDFLRNHIVFQKHTELKLTNRGGLVNLPLLEETKSLPCLIPMNMITITNKGTVLPCFEDYHQQNEMGNLNESTLSEIWNSKEYMLFRKKIAMGLRSEYKVCSTCSRRESLGIY